MPLSTCRKRSESTASFQVPRQSTRGFLQGAHTKRKDIAGSQKHKGCGFFPVRASQMSYFTACSREIVVFYTSPSTSQASFSTSPACPTNIPSITNKSCYPTQLERRPRKLALFSGRVEQQRPVSALKGCSKTCVHSQSTRPVVEERPRNAAQHETNIQTT